MRIKDESKELQIINAAIALISQSGLDGLKMATVAQNAGVATGTIYIYFKDRESLITAIYQYVIKASANNFVYQFDVNTPTKAKIKSLCRAYLLNFIVNPGYSVFLEQFYRSTYFQTDRTFITVRNNAYSPVFQVIKEGQVQGIIKDIDPNLISIATAGLLREVCKVFNYTNETIEEDKWEQVFSMVWDGMKS